MSSTLIRKWHNYLGLFIAPSVLFFSLTGALQLFSLHESHGDYHPPPLLEKLASVHKDQVFRADDHHGPRGPEALTGQPSSDLKSPEGAASRGAPPAEHEPESATTLLLKSFFLLVALSLASSTILGLWMGLRHARSRKTAWSLAIAGSLIPLVLLLITATSS